MNHTHSTKTHHPRGALLLAILVAAIGLGGCSGQIESTGPQTDVTTTDVAEPIEEEPAPDEVSSIEEPSGVPSPDEQSASDEMIDREEIPQFAANSPFDTDYQAPAVVQGRRLWARSYRWAQAPEFVVEKWLTDQPDTEGKYVLIEFWATWCGPCRRSIPLLNGFHEKYGDELVVIGVSDETEEDVRKMESPQIDFFSAVDTQARMKDELGVFGVPHAILLEPSGCVIWEGFPLLEGYELTDEIIENVLAVGRTQKAKAAGS